MTNSTNSITLPPQVEYIRSLIPRLKKQTPQAAPLPVDKTTSFEEDEKKKPSVPLQQLILGMLPKLHHPQDVQHHEKSEISISALNDSALERAIFNSMEDLRSQQSDSLRYTAQEIHHQQKINKSLHLNLDKVNEKISGKAKAISWADIARKVTAVFLVVAGITGIAAGVVTGGVSAAFGVVSLLAGVSSASAQATHSISSLQMKKQQAQATEIRETRALNHATIQKLIGDTEKIRSRAEQLWSMQHTILKNRSAIR